MVSMALWPRRSRARQVASRLSGKITLLRHSLRSRRLDLRWTRLPFGADPDENQRRDPVAGTPRHGVLTEIYFDSTAGHVR
jgi:hypothetical protein